MPRREQHFVKLETFNALVMDIVSHCTVNVCVRFFFMILEGPNYLETVLSVSELDI